MRLLGRDRTKTSAFQGHFAEEDQRKLIGSHFYANWFSANPGFDLIPGLAGAVHAAVVAVAGVQPGWNHGVANPG